MRHIADECPPWGADSTEWPVPPGFERAAARTRSQPDWPAPPSRERNEALASSQPEHGTHRHTIPNLERQRIRGNVRDIAGQCLPWLADSSENPPAMDEGRTLPEANTPSQPDNDWGWGQGPLTQFITRDPNPGAGQVRAVGPRVRECLERQRLQRARDGEPWEGDEAWLEALHERRRTRRATSLLGYPVPRHWPSDTAFRRQSPFPLGWPPYGGTNTSTWHHASTQATPEAGAHIDAITQTTAEPPTRGSQARANGTNPSATPYRPPVGAVGAVTRTSEQPAQPATERTQQPGIQRRSPDRRQSTPTLRVRTLTAATMIIASTPAASSMPTTTWAVRTEWTTIHMVVLALATLYLLKSLSQLYSQARSAWTLLTRVLATLSIVTSYMWLLPIPQVGGVYQPKLMLFAAAALHAALPASADKVALIYEHHQHTDNVAPSNGVLLSAIGMAASAWTLQKLLPLARGPTSGPTLQPTRDTATPKEAGPSQSSRGGKRSTVRNPGSPSKVTRDQSRDLNRAKWAPPPRPLSVMAAASYASALATLAGLHHAFLRMTPTAKSTTEQGVETSVLFAVTGALATTMLTVVAGTTFRIHPTRVDRGPSARVTRRRLAVLVLILLTVCAPCTTSATVDSATPTDHRDRT